LNLERKAKLVVIAASNALSYSKGPGSQKAKAKAAGYKAQCEGAYLAAICNGNKPPTADELAYVWDEEAGAG
jgi:hypothetical protein